MAKWQFSQTCLHLLFNTLDAKRQLEEVLLHHGAWLHGLLALWLSYNDGLASAAAKQLRKTKTRTEIASG